MLHTSKKLSMTTLRRLAAVAALVLTGCSQVSAFDSCTRSRHFKQFTTPSRAYFSLPLVDVRSIPPSVQAASAAYMHRFGEDYFEILEARSTGHYLLLTVRPACLDCDRWLVYSYNRQCIVGMFWAAGQG